MINPKTILITGASSGLGRELALQYADRDATLFLTGRDMDRLTATARECEARGAKVWFRSMDIRDEKTVTEWIAQCDLQSPIELVIANAGISAGPGGNSENVAQVKNIFSTNIDGVINTIQPLIPLMRKRERGQIAIISSLASYRGLPSAPAYSASKAAVRFYGEGLRGILYKYGIGVTVVTPGYIKTRMTSANKFPMPFLMEAEKAARIIKKKLTKNPSRIAFPRLFYYLVLWIGALPPVLTDPLFKILPAKRPQK